MKTTGLLLISLWSLCWARPIARYPGAHHSSSKEHWTISVEESLNKIADSTDHEDAGNRRSSSTEDRRKDLGDNSCENCERNSFPRKVSSSSLESFSEDDHERSTQDNEEGGYFRPQMVHRKWADSKDSHNHDHQQEINEESSDDESAGRMSLEDQSEGHLYGANKESKEQFDVENDGMLYTPEQVLYTFVEKGGSDLTTEEDTSGDDSLDEDPGHTKSPSEVDALQPPATHGEQDGNTVSQHSDDSSSSSSSSSSSESRNLEKEDNHIIDYGRQHGSDSYSSSQEDRYDFQSEEMQGDDPRAFESPDSDSHMLPEAVHSKESSQEISRERGKGETVHQSKTIEHFERNVYNYVDGDSDEDNSPEYEKNKSLKEDDDNSEVDSRLVEDISQSTENVPSQSREDATSHSGKSVESSSKRHSHSQSRENFNSHSREDMHSRSREDDKHSRSREDDKHSQSREDDKHSRSREDDKHSQSREDDKQSRSREDDKHSRSREDDKHSRSREDDKHSRSREDDKHSQSREDDKHSRSREDDKHSRSREDDKHSRSREDDKHSRSREDDKHSWSREDDKHSRSREDDKHSQSREDETRGHSHSQSKENISSHSREDKHSQSREDDVHSQSRELSRQSREDEDTISEEDIKSESTEDTRSSQEKDFVEKSKETEEESDEHSSSQSKNQESHSVEKSGNMPPRATESREFKWHHSRSSEKSSSMEESEESAEDTKDDSRLSQSVSSESSKLSEESASSDDSNSDEDGQDQQSQSAETSESKEEEDSYPTERHSQSREDTMSQSDSMEDNSWSRSMELENRKLMLDIYHNKPFSDYDDNDCQDGY